MRLPIILGATGVAWCVLGAVAIGPGILVYPLAWGAILFMFIGLHQWSTQSRRQQAKASRQKSQAPIHSQFSGDHTAAA